MPAYVLQRSAASTAPPVLDDSQRAVLEHGADGGGGPLLVLAGPGTGKTTTLVELVVDRVERGLPPDEALVLTFSRKAAQQLRSRIARRLPGAGVVPVMTFHAYCYALVRAASPPEQFADPLRLLSAPEQEWRMAEVLLGASEMGRVTWPTELQPALRTRGFARELVDFIGRARSYDLDPAGLRVLADEREEHAWHSIADLWTEYEEVLALARETDYSGSSTRRTESRRSPSRGSSWSTSTRTPTLSKWLCSRASSGRAPISSLSAILTSRSTPSVVLTCRGIWTFADRFGTPARPAPRSRCAGRAVSARRCWKRRAR